MEWKAYYNDGSVLKQFENETENLFRDIDQERLRSFQIGNDYEGIYLSLNDGVFVIGEEIVAIDGLSHKDLDYRLIYFRRNRKVIGTKNLDGGNSIAYHIGFQVIVDGKNRKVIFAAQDGKVTIIVE